MREHSGSSGTSEGKRISMTAIHDTPKRKRCQWRIQEGNRPCVDPTAFISSSSPAKQIQGKRQKERRRTHPSENSSSTTLDVHGGEGEMMRGIRASLHGPQVLPVPQTYDARYLCDVWYSVSWNVKCRQNILNHTCKDEKKRLHTARESIGASLHEEGGRQGGHWPLFMLELHP